MQFRKSVPSLTALVALEATVRHRSVTSAARELGVTQAAVSRQVAALEAELGFPLFRRGHRSIEPTGACAALAATLSVSFAAIADGVETLRASAAHEVVTIGATLAFSAFWLLPRLAEFRRLHPGVQIRVVSQDARLNLDGGGVDVAIRYGVPPYPDAKVVAARADLVMPVCSPAYAERMGGVSTWKGPYDLIEMDVPERSWISWQDWFARVGRKDSAAPALRLSHYTEAIAAARSGQGLAFGWRVLVGDFIADGSLVRVGEDELVPAERHTVIVPARARRSPLGDLVADWMADALLR